MLYFLEKISKKMKIYHEREIIVMKKYRIALVINSKNRKELEKVYLVEYLKYLEYFSLFIITIFLMTIFDMIFKYKYSQINKV